MKKWMSGALAFSMIASMLAVPAAYAENELSMVKLSRNIPLVGKTNEQKGAQITIRETQNDSWGREEFIFTLPDGVSWGYGTKVNGEVVSASDRELRVSFNGTKNIDTLYITPVLDVNRKVAFGDISLSVDKGPIAPKDARLTIAKVTDYGLVLEERSGEQVIPYGDMNARAVKVRIHEMIDDSMIRGAAYELSLKNASFNQKGSLGTKVIEGNKQLTRKYVDDMMVLGTMTQGKKSAWELDFEIIPQKDATGDIVLTLKGRGMTEQSVILGSISKDVEFKVQEAKNLSLGYKDQSLPELTIQESKGGALIKGSYEIRIEPFHRDNAIEKADLEVSDGNLSIEKVKYEDGKITFQVSRESMWPSVLTVKDVKMTLSNSAYLGEHNAQLMLINKGKDPVKLGELVWFNTSALTDDPSKPAPSRVAQFVIGKENYELFVKGTKEERTFDVAPYIESGRTMMSVKAVADAMDMEVGYEAATKTVTIKEKKENGKVVTFNIGEKVAMLNGQPMPMDVAPVIKDSRTFVPVSYVGHLFGVKVDWNGDLKMVTVTMN